VSQRSTPVWEAPYLHCPQCTRDRVARVRHVETERIVQFCKVMVGALPGAQSAPGPSLRAILTCGAPPSTMPKLSAVVYKKITTCGKFAPANAVSKRGRRWWARADAVRCALFCRLAERLVQTARKSVESQNHTWQRRVHIICMRSTLKHVRLLQALVPGLSTYWMSTVWCSCQPTNQRHPKTSHAKLDLTSDDIAAVFGFVVGCSTYIA
jgi:hypothetical protein